MNTRSWFGYLIYFIASFQGLATSSTTTTTAASTCYDDWSKVLDRKSQPVLCIKKFNGRANWTEALNTCRTYGAHLPVLDSAFYDSITTLSVQQILRNIYNISSTAPALNSTWIGLHIDENSGKLYWDFDKPLTVTTSANPTNNWLWNNTESAFGECGAVLTITSATSQTVSLQNCSIQLPFICVKKSTVLSLTPEIQCPVDWLGNYDSNLCYWFSPSTSTLPFNQAQKKCMDMGRTLVQPSNYFENGLINSIIDPALTSSSENYWIGCYANGTTVDGLQWTYKNGETMTYVTPGYCMAAVSNLYGSSIKWNQFNCSTSSRFICQRPATANQVEILQDPQSDTILQNSYTDYVLTCNASNFHPELPVVWVKDGIYINASQIPPQGFTLNLGQVLANNRWFMSGPNDLQGYYHCEIWSLSATPQRTRVKSNKALITFKDVATYYGQATISGKNSSNLNATICIITVCNLTPNNSEILSIFRPTRLRVTTTVTEITSENCIFFTVYVWLNLSVDLTELLRQNSSFKDHLFLKQFVYLKLLAAGQENLPYFSLKWADACVLGTAANLTNYATFPITFLGHSANSYEVCSSDGKPMASAYCSGCFTTGGQWLAVQLCTNSPPDFFSSSTESLISLSEAEVTYSNAADTAYSLSMLTENSSYLIPLDITYASIVLIKIAALPGVDSQVTEHFLSAVDNLAVAKTTVLFSAQSSAQSTSRIVSAVDLLSTNVALDRTQSNITSIKQNIIFQVIQMEHSLQGYGFAVSNLTWADNSPEMFQNFFNRSADDSILSPSETAIFFSQEALTKGQEALGLLWRGAERSYRISCVVYSNNKFFGTSDKANGQAVNSLVMSGAVNGIQIYNLSQPISLIFRLKEANIKDNITCSYWGADETTGESTWLSKGLWLSNDTSSQQSTNTTVVCYSRHLTNFAVIAGFTGSPDSTFGRALQYISIIGLSLSIFGLLLVILTILLFPRILRGRSSMVLLQLSIALLAVDILVLAGIDKTNPVAGCKAVAALLLYFLLASFCWMLVEAVIQYLKFVKVFDTYTSHFMLKASLPAWIVPGIIVVVVAICDGTGSNLLRGPVYYCWLAANAFHFAFLLPLGIIMVVNIIMFILVVKGITCDRPKGLRSTQKKEDLIVLQVITAIGCFIVMGLTWLFAFFAVDAVAIPFQVLFCIFNSLQGFLIFLFFTVRDKSVRDAWKKLLLPCVRKLQYHRTKSAHGGKVGYNSTSNVIQDSSANTESNSCREDSSDGTKSSSQDQEIRRESDVSQNDVSSRTHLSHSDTYVTHGIASQYKDSPCDLYITRINSSYTSTLK